MIKTTNGDRALITAAFVLTCILVCVSISGATTGFPPHPIFALACIAIGTPTGWKLAPHIIDWMAK